MKPDLLPRLHVELEGVKDYWPSVWHLLREATDAVEQLIHERRKPACMYCTVEPFLGRTASNR
jgi:hypothetical protein